MAKPGTYYVNYVATENIYETGYVHPHPMKAWIVLLILACAAPIELFGQAIHAPKPLPHVSEPLSFDGLTIWLVDGADGLQHPYVTLEQALASGSAVIYNENIQTLAIVNRSDTDLFIEAGDLIKGGQQDRMIVDDRVLPAHDSASDLNVLCVEQGRSTARGTEPLATFSSSHWMAPAAHTRLVARSSLTEQLLTPQVGGLTAPDSSKLELLNALPDLSAPFGYPDATQESVWNDVAEVQRALTQSLRDSVTRNASPTSLELALEHPALAERVASFERHFGNAARDNARAVGLVYAIHGRLIGAEQYATHALFSAMWPKFLRSIAAATIAAVPPATITIPSVEQVENFLAEHGSTTAHARINSRTLIEAAKIEDGTRFTSIDQQFAPAPLHVEWIAH